MSQELIWIPKMKEGARRCDPVPFKGKDPKYVWTLYLETEESKKPELPIKPKHHFNAFLEDRMHDWDIRKKEFFYYSRISDGGVWLLFEYE